MLTRQNISVTLIRQSDGKEFPEFSYARTTEVEKIYSYSAIKAEHADIFFPRVIIDRSFDWKESNSLAVRVNYSRNWNEGPCLEFPRIPKPASPTAITLDLRQIFLWDAGWKNASSQFVHVPVS